MKKKSLLLGVIMLFAICATACTPHASTSETSNTSGSMSTSTSTSTKVGVSDCCSEPPFPITSSVISSSTSSSSVPIIPPSYDCFTVELISKDDYKTNEFSQVFTNYKEKNDVTYTSDNPTLSVANVMPHNVVDTYGVALFTVRTTDANQTYDDAYLYYNNELYRVSPMTVRSNKENFTVFGNVVDIAFTDVNKDNAYEVTVSYRYEDGFVYLTTLDLKSGEMVNSYYGMRNEYSLKKKDNAIAIYQDNELLAYIESYTRDYAINEPTVTLTNTNYKVDITWSKFETCVPVDYPNLQHRFKVDVNLMYLGETFTYTGSMAPDSPEVFFYKGDVEVKRVETLVDTAIEDHTVFKYDELTATHYFYDEYNRYNASGTYDIKVSFRDMVITKENVLTIK